MKGDPYALRKSEHVWRHNSLKGKAGMARVNLESIYNSPSTTPETKDIARQMLKLMEPLQRSLDHRIDEG